MNKEAEEILLKEDSKQYDLVSKSKILSNL